MSQIKIVALKRYFTREYIEMANKQIKRYSIPLIIRETQISNIYTRKAKIKKD